MNNSKIEWTDKTWNPVTGCDKISAGCKYCYAETIYERFHGKGSFRNVICHEDRLTQPLKWKKGCKVFVNSMSDLFHEDVPFVFIDKVMAIIALTPRSVYQVLTKRSSRMLEYFSVGKEALIERWEQATYDMGLSDKEDDTDAPACVIYNYTQTHWPLPNLWLGVSVEDQKAANERIPLLLQVPAAVRFLSCEPLLGEVDIASDEINDQLFGSFNHSSSKGIDWVIVGGESGNKARPMHPDWARSLCDQCNAANIPFFFKQWGEYAPAHDLQCNDFKGKAWVNFDPDTSVVRMGKKKAGRLLDGKEYSEFPKLE
jgi:protein gp37